MKRNLLTSEG